MKVRNVPLTEFQIALIKSAAKRLRLAIESSEVVISEGSLISRNLYLQELRTLEELA